MLSLSLVVFEKPLQVVSPMGMHGLRVVISTGMHGLQVSGRNLQLDCRSVSKNRSDSNCFDSVMVKENS